MPRLALGTLAAAFILLTAPALAQSQYDESWHRASFWSGEYPDGFSVAKTTTVQLRPRLDPEAEKTIACELPGGATYQPWNQPRVEEQGLFFVSFTRIAQYRMIEPYATSLLRHLDGAEVNVSLKEDDTWRYLAYFGEGAFLMEHDGVQYDGDPDLLEHAQQEGDRSGYEEWLRINCPDNQWGWLYMGDITLDDGSFVSPNITSYGMAEDLK